MEIYRSFNFGNLTPSDLDAVLAVGNEAENNIDLVSDTLNLSFTIRTSDWSGSGFYVDKSGYLNTFSAGKYLDIDPSDQTINFGSSTNGTSSSGVTKLQGVGDAVGNKTITVPHETGEMFVKTYKSIIGKLKQIGTGDATFVEIYSNNLGFTPVFTRSSAGTYSFSHASIVDGKICFIGSHQTGGQDKSSVKFDYWEGTMEVYGQQLNLGTGFDEYVDNVINNVVEIRIYD